MEAITREEQLLNSIATKEAVNIDPITREEQYLAYIAGLTDKKPEKAITRKEMFYDAIAENGTGGGGGTAKPEQSKTVEIVENGDYKVTPDSGKVLSSVTAKVNVPERYDEGFQAGVDSVKLQEKTATENGDVLPDDGFDGMSKVIVAVPAGSGKEEQEKTVTIKENGTTEVTPDEGKTLSKVTVETNVATSGGNDELIKALVEGGATELILPDSVSKIKNNAFYQDTTLTNIHAAGVESMGNYAFAECTKLALTELPAGLKSIGANAFKSCTNLALTELPAGVESIDVYAFAECTKLALTELPAGVTNINNQSFQYCTKLALTELPAGVTRVGLSAFKNCLGLTTITFNSTPNYMAATAFDGCTNLTTINVPWAEGEVDNAPFGAKNATINYNYTGA